MPPALRVEGLSYAYTRRRPALEDVGFTVPAGRFVALLGPNGAGKTTLMSLVTRLFQARGGTITVGGHDLGRAPRTALARMGVVFQRLTLDLDLTVEQNLRYAAGLYGLDAATAGERIERGLDRLQLRPRRASYARTLSGGLRRRVELARALLHRPQLLVLDEPTVGLDIDSRRAIVEHVHALCRDEGLAVLWATHLIDEVAGDDHVVILAGGRVRATGTSAELVRRYGGEDLAPAYQALTASTLAA